MAIAGSFTRADSGPATFDLSRSLGAMALTKSRPSIWQGQGAALGKCDSALLAQDRRFPGRAAVFEGRLDNRRELATAIDGADPSLQTLSAAELSLFAYDTWGKDFADHMVGDFACAIWDGPAQRLLLARDAVGVRPLFFWQGPEAIVFATEPRGLLVHPAIPKATDEIWLARFLALLPEVGTRSHYQDIERVPPGHVVTFDASGMDLNRYWRPEELAPIRFARHSDYCDALRAIFEEAVRCRIDTSDGIGSYLSGGLDSASVTVVASKLLAERGRKLTSFTAVPTHDFKTDEKSNRYGDEREFAALTAAACSNVEHVLVPNISDTMFNAIDNVSLNDDRPVLNPFHEIWLNAIARAARERGITVLLSGQMGNMTISYDGNGLIRNLLRQGLWTHLVKAARLYRQMGASWTGIAYRIFGPSLPLALRRRLLAMRGHPTFELPVFSALDMDFARQTGVAEEAVSMEGNVENLSTDVRLNVIHRVDLGLHFRGYKRRFGIDVLDPTADRRLVEYCIAIPEEQFVHNGQIKSLLKNAFRGIIPDRVLDQKGRGLQAADWHVAAKAAQAEMLAEIDRLEKSPLASRALDVAGMRELAATMPDTGWHKPEVVYAYQLKLARGLAAGRFVRRIDGGNA